MGGHGGEGQRERMTQHQHQHGERRFPNVGSSSCRAGLAVPDTGLSQNFRRAPPC